MTQNPTQVTSDGQTVITPASVKPGIQTTEFWLSTLSTIFFALMSAGTFPDTPVWVRITSVIAAVLSTLGYGQVRSAIKQAAIPLLLICLALGLTGCPPLPPNPSNSQIAAAQNQITNLELAYIAFTTPVDIEISKPTFDASKRQLIQAAEQLIWQELNKAYNAAANGQNVDAHTLTVDLENFKRQIIAIQNGTAATRP